MVAAVVGAASIAANLYTSSQQSDAAGNASQTQIASNDASIAEQRDARAQLQKLLAPWVQAGGTALTGQQDLLGVNGAPAQDFAISQIRNSPAFTSTKKVGEDAILQNASATGGLRGGNVQAGLAQFDESLLSRLIDQQYGRLTGLSGQGQNAASGVGAGTLSTANAITGLNSDNGAAAAGGILGQARAGATGINGLVNGAGVIAGRLGATSTFNPSTSYNAAGTFQPYYTGYDSAGGPAYG